MLIAGGLMRIVISTSVRTIFMHVVQRANNTCWGCIATRVFGATVSIRRIGAFLREENTGTW